MIYYNIISTFYIFDIDNNYSTIIPFNRGITYFNNNTFEFSNGPLSVININLISNNFDNIYNYRIIFENYNKFKNNNNIETIILFEDDKKELSFECNVSSIYFNKIIFEDNISPYLIKPIYIGTILIIFIDNSIFINNDLQNGVIALNYASLYFSNSN